MAERYKASPKGTLPTEHTGQRPAPASDRFITRLQGLIHGAEQDPKYKVSGEVVSPATIIHYELLSEVQRVQPQDQKPGNQQMADFFQTISDAWGVIAFDHLTMRITKENVADTLYYRHMRAKDAHQPHPDTITLLPQQTAIIDALAEAAKIPNHKKGQERITIPAKFLRFDYQPDEL